MMQAGDRSCKEGRSCNGGQKRSLSVSLSSSEGESMLRYDESRIIFFFVRNTVGVLRTYLSNNTAGTVA